MKKIITLIAALICTMRVLAGTDGNKESNFARTDDFKLIYAQNEGSFSCKLRGTYTSTDDKYTLYFVRDSNQYEKLLVLDAPLNYQYFGDKFLEGLRTINENIKPLSNRSVQEVFTWLYTLNIDDQDDDVVSGVLLLKQWIMVLPGNGKTILEAKKREKIVDSLTELYNATQTRIGQTGNRLDTLLREKINAAKSDTAKALKAKNDATGSWIISKYLVDLKTMEEAEIRKDSLAKDSFLKGLPAGTDTLKKIKDSVTNSIKEIGKQLEECRKSLASLRKQAQTDEQTKIDADNHYKKELEKLAKDNINDITVYNKILSNLRMGIYNNAADIVNDTAEINNSNISSLLQRYVDQKGKLKKIDSTQLNSFSIHSIRRISILFERGYIERIQAWIGNGHGGEDIYENIYAIGVTSINNLRQMDNIRLFIRRSSGNDFIFLSDLFGNYDNFLASFTRDYSPADTALNNLMPSEQPRITLKKERVINLFDAKVYTDFAGLQQDAPNGLIQTEVCRRFNIHSYRGQISNTRQDWGSLNYLYAYGALTKIEDKERRLPLRNQNVVVNNTLASPSYTTNLDLRRYENASAGLYANLLLYDNPDFKITFYLDAGIRYGHIPIADSLRNIKNGAVDSSSIAINRDAHTITYEPIRLTLEVFSERRVGLTLNYQFNITHLYSNQFKQVASYEKSNLTAFPVDRMARQMHMFEMTLRVETSRLNNGRIFLRTRFFWQRGDVNTFFPQLQLGYAYNLVYRK